MLNLTPQQIRDIYESEDTELQNLVYQAATHPYYSFVPRPNAPEEWDEQQAFVDDKTSSFAILLGGNGSGKTEAAAAKTARYVLETPPPRERCPFWIIGEYFDQVCNVAWVGKLSRYIPESEILGYVWLNSRRQWPRSVLLRHPVHRDSPGWILEFKSYEQGLGAMKGDSIGGYWFNEEVPFSLVHEVRMRCRDYASPGWADFTPVECKDPEWPEAYDNPPEGWRFFHLNTTKNNYLPEGWFERELKSIPEDMREMRTIGKFAVLHGQVYKEWRKSIHVVPSHQQFEIPKDWPKFRSIDFGFNNPFCCLWTARDHDGGYWVYDEHYETQKLNTWHAEKINERHWDYSQPWYGPTYSDHDAQQRAEFAAKGIYCTPANKSVNQGIECLRSMMMIQDDGKPRFHVFERCKNLIREIPGYKWPDASVSRNPSDVPIPVNDHACDAARYGIFSDFLSGRSQRMHGQRHLIDSSRHGVRFKRRGA